MDKLLIILIPESHVIEDKIVNFYFNLISTRKRENNWPKVDVVPVDLYTTFVGEGYDSVKGMTEGRNIFDCDLIFVPIKSNTDGIDMVYNIVLCVVDMKLEKITLYDPKGRSSKFLQEHFHPVRIYLNQEYQRIYRQPLRDDTFNFTFTMDLPISETNRHSRVFTCQYAECLSRGKRLQMTEEIFFYRLKMISEIYNKRIEIPRN